MSNTFSAQLTQQRITDAGGREFRFRGDLYSQESTFPVVLHCVLQQNSSELSIGWVGLGRDFRFLLVHL